MDYAVDIVLAIDCTGSMASAIGYAKNHALEFHDQLMKAMDAKQKGISQLRVKVISFRDYYNDPPEMAMAESTFFTLPQESDKLSEFVNNLHASGGGPEPECSLEAIALAIQSDWETGHDKSRQIIVLWTDASAHSLEKEGKPATYPSVPDSFADLSSTWGQGLAATSKRLILFAPALDPWPTVAEHWDNVIHFESSAGQGLGDVDYNVILNSIANSV